MFVQLPRSLFKFLCPMEYVEGSACPCCYFGKVSLFVLVCVCVSSKTCSHSNPSWKSSDETFHQNTQTHVSCFSDCKFDEFNLYREKKNEQTQLQPWILHIFRHANIICWKIGKTVWFFILFLFARSLSAREREHVIFHYSNKLQTNIVISVSIYRRYICKHITEKKWFCLWRYMHYLVS